MVLIEFQNNFYKKPYSFKIIYYKEFLSRDIEIIKF
jgi:hypothetical protein